MHWSTIIKIIIAIGLIAGISYFSIEIWRYNQKKEGATASVTDETIPKIITELNDLQNSKKSEVEVKVADILPPKNFVYPQKKDAIVHVPIWRGRIGASGQYGTTCRHDHECPKNTTCNKQGYCIPIFNLFEEDSYNEIMGRGRSGEEENSVKLVSSR